MKSTTEGGLSENPTSDPDCLCPRAHAHMPGLLCGSQTTFPSAVYFRSWWKNGEKKKETKKRNKKKEMDFIKIRLDSTSFYVSRSGITVEAPCILSQAKLSVSKSPRQQQQSASGNMGSGIVEISLTC